MSPILSTSRSQSKGGECFQEIFGTVPSISARAPGRINLIGEHVDYQEGLVMPAAIDRYVFASARAITEPEVRIWSSAGGEITVIPLDRETPLTGEQHWANYVFGVIAKYRDAGHAVPGFEATFDANLPVGAGLSSSAALESASALIAEGLLDIELAPTQRALLCQAAEHHWAGVPCGIMDQMVVNCAVAGQALRIDCRSLESIPVPLPADLAVVVVDSKVKHALADGEYAKRKADCETAAQALAVRSLRDVSPGMLESAREVLPERIFRRARHVVTEIERVRKFGAALDRGEAESAGASMSGSHASLRDDFEVSCAELDGLVEIAGQLGAIGARMMGGGFGGSTVNLVPTSRACEFAQSITARYHQLHGSEVDAFIVKPVSGAIRESTA